MLLYGVKKHFLLILMLQGVNPVLHALDFAIVNKGNIIFQEIIIENPSDGNDYYYNFGINGLEPGARHNVHINSREELLVCSFFLHGIAQESYIIENVAIEQNSMVYILPEHFREDSESFRELGSPDAVYDMTQLPGREGRWADIPAEGQWENEILGQIELFNYTNSDIFRAYLKIDGIDNETDYLKGKPLRPLQSRTIALPLDDNHEYQLELMDGKGNLFLKTIPMPMEADFLVFYDSDKETALISRPLILRNEMDEEIVEVFIIDQLGSSRIEVLQERILPPNKELEILVETDFSICDIIAFTASRRKVYIFDFNMENHDTIVIGGD